MPNSLGDMPRTLCLPTPVRASYTAPVPVSSFSCLTWVGGWVAVARVGVAARAAGGWEVQVEAGTVAGVAVGWEGSVAVGKEVGCTMVMEAQGS